MNNKAIVLIKNLSYTLISNLISLLVSTVVVLIIPKLLGVEEYGYWQLYLFYSSYVGFLHFGWNDGIYLRYGGKEYRELDKKLFYSQFYMLAILQFFIVVFIFVISNTLVTNLNKSFILEMTGLCVFIINLRIMLLFILQGTNRIQEYAKVTLLDRVLYIALILFFLILGVRDFRLMVAADLIGKLASLVYVMYYCRDIIFQKVSLFYFSFREAIDNINAGVKLMISNIASILIIGVVRFGIERSWDVSTFGKVSLTLSISNLMMAFINAIGIIMFPILKRTNSKNLPSIYITMRDFLMVILLGILIFYYPLKAGLSLWLPKYAESLIYMSLLFPISVYEGKMAILINTYLKALRKEKLMLKINIISLLLSIVITLITTLLLRNLNLAVLSIVALLIFRSVLAEMLLSKILKISVYKNIILEISLTLIFILTGWFINSLATVFLYGVAYICYLIMKRKEINTTINNLKILGFKNN